MCYESIHHHLSQGDCATSNVLLTCRSTSRRTDYSERYPMLRSVTDCINIKNCSEHCCPFGKNNAVLLIQ
jgi:hypothetical protein